jgi:hypothetical protein
MFLRNVGIYLRVYNGVRVPEEHRHYLENLASLLCADKKEIVWINLIRKSIVCNLFPPPKVYLLFYFLILYEALILLEPE